MAEQIPPSPEPTGLDYLAVAIAWVVPGLGHFFIREKARGIIFAITIHVLFALGLLIGGVRAINPPEQPIWSYTQFMAGWPMVASQFVQKQTRIDPRTYAPHCMDVGAVYCGIAGMLNLLVMFDVLIRVSGGRRPAPTPPGGGGAA